MMLKWLFDLSVLGVHLEPENVRRRIVFSNIVFLTLPVVYIIFMMVDYESYLQPVHTLRFDQFIVPIVIAVCAFCLWLNKINQTIISRVLFIILWPVLLHLIPIITLHTPPDYYLAFPIGIIFHAVLIQLMFSYREEPVSFWLSIVLNFSAMIFVLDILLFFDTDQPRPTAILGDSLFGDKYFVLDGILYWLLFNLVGFYMIRSIEKYIVKINTWLAIIENQKAQVSMLNKNLEDLVVQRTQKLEEQNKKLRDHAFYNAHLLRGPFCRIQGLVQLRSLIPDSERDEIDTKLQVSINELDERIKEIQRIVDTDAVTEER